METINIINSSEEKNEYFEPNLTIPANPNWIPEVKTLGEFAMTNMKKYKIKIALIEATTGNYINYETFLSQIISTAKEIKNQGLVYKDTIAICSRNSMVNTIPIYASVFVGVIPANLDPTLSISDTTNLIKLVEPKLIFVEPESVGLIETALEKCRLDTKIVIFGYTDKYIPFESFLNESNELDEDFEVEVHGSIDDVAMILFSSGSTGLPKGLCLSHYGLIYEAYALSGFPGKSLANRQLRPTGRVLNFATPYWISTILSMNMTILNGDARIIVSNFDVENCFKYIQVYKIGSVSMSTFISYKITQNPHFAKKYKSTSLKMLIVAGGAMSEQHLNDLRKLFPTTIVANVYGQTEICGATFFFNIFKELELMIHKGVSVGKPIPGINVKVVDIETQSPVGPNNLGELRTKSRCLLRTYYKNEEEFKKQFDEEGYLRTGDIAYYDEDYCFYIVDRIKEMMKYQSWHVTPVTIETVILTHPGVAEVMVTGVPDEVDGEHPIAVIIPKQGVNLTENEIVDYVDERLSDRYKLRAGVIFVKDLPKTPGGKLRRALIRQMILKGEF